MLAYTVRYAVSVAGQIQRGELVIMANAASAARLRARERILFLCGHEATWISITHVV